MTAVPNTQAFDLAILGAGPGGYSAALRAARRGASVALVDGKQMGGVCLNSGCIPTKALLASADLLRNAARAKDFALRLTAASPHLPALAARQQGIVAQMAKGLEFLLSRAGVTVITGRGRLLGNKQIDSGGQIITANKIIIATGSRPAPLTGFPCDGARVFDSDQILRLEKIPSRLAIIGGGYIGCEFASLFAALGSKVTIHELTEQLLPGLDADLATALAKSFSKDGIDVKTNTRLASAAEIADADAILVAVGRVPNLDTFNREAENLALDDRGRFICVDDHLCTSAPDIYAIGDLTGKSMLAHVALAQARIAVENALAAKPTHTIIYDVVPACVFTHPEIATVGLTEFQARAHGRTIKIGKFPFAALGKAAAVAAPDGFVKLIADATTEKLLGGHIFGGAASEQIGMISLALAQGLTARQLADTIVAHPTFNEAIAEAAEAIFSQSLHLARPMR